MQKRTIIERFLEALKASDVESACAFVAKGAVQPGQEVA